MSTITILPEGTAAPPTSFRAIAGATESSGKTAGEALDAINEKLTGADAVRLVVLHSNCPDPLFTAVQQKRLAELMQWWRIARDTSVALPPDLHAELDSLVDAEMRAAAERAAALVRGLQP